MKVLKFIVLMSLTAAAFAQTPAATTEPNDAQKAFTELKALAGKWDATITTEPKMPQIDQGGPAQVTMRVTSRGNSLVHEMYDPQHPNEPSHFDHPVTMFYVDGDRLVLTHYCDAGNRPRMAARASDGKTIEFDFVDVTGNMKHGHMEHALFTFIDADHHTEDWTFMMPGDKPVRAHLDMKRAK